MGKTQKSDTVEKQAENTADKKSSDSKDIKL
jgi:hypothetical protein